jgi:hypothetical protein
MFCNCVVFVFMCSECDVLIPGLFYTLLPRANRTHLYLSILQSTIFSLFLVLQSMLSGSLVTTAWRVLKLRMEEKASRYGG